MSAGPPQALQDTLLEHLRKHKVPVTIFLANGIRLQGTATGFDTYASLLGRDHQSHVDERRLTALALCLARGDWHLGGQAADGSPVHPKEPREIRRALPA